MTLFSQKQKVGFSLVTDEVLLQSGTSAAEDTRKLSLQDTTWGKEGERESGRRLILKSI